MTPAKKAAKKAAKPADSLQEAKSPVQDPPTVPARSRRKTWLFVVIAILVVAAGALAYVFAPIAQELAPYDDSEGELVRAQNAAVYATLISGGITDPFVDVLPERVYVAYELPDGYDPDMTQRFVIGAAADAAFSSEEIVVLQYENDEPKRLWRVRTADFAEFMHERITGEELEERIEKEDV